MRTTKKPVKKPVCKLIGTDGNVFSLAARVMEALKKAKQEDNAAAVRTRLRTCESYAAALQLFAEYVTIR